MPEISIDVSVYCGTCNEGLCRITDVTDTVITVDACPACMEAKDDEIKGLEKQADELLDEIDQLKVHIEDLEREG